MGVTGRAADMLFSLDSEVMSVVWVSLEVSVIATILSSLVGIPLGAVIALKPFVGRKMVRLALNTLMALPTVVVGLLVYGLIGRQGPLGHYNMLFTPQAMVLGLFVLSLPIVTNLTISAIDSSDRRFRDTCVLLGASTLRTAWLGICEMREAVLAAVVAGFGRVVAEVGVAMMVGGNIRGFTRTMTTAIAMETGKGEFEFALALGMVLMLVALVVNVALFSLGRRRK